MQSMRVQRHLVDTVPIGGDNPPDIDPRVAAKFLIPALFWREHRARRSQSQQADNPLGFLQIGIHQTYFLWVVPCLRTSRLALCRSLVVLGADRGRHSARDRDQESQAIDALPQSRNPRGVPADAAS